MWNDLRKEWSDKNIEPFSSFSSGSGKKAWWICDKGHEWQESICNRSSKNTRCPYCINRRAHDGNCLKTMCPLLALEWHPSKNANITPDQVVFTSHRKVWWICSKKHEWEAEIVKRSKYNRGCPYCSNQKVCDDNSLKNKFPELALEWHPTKNNQLKPENVVYGCCKKV